MFAVVLDRFGPPRVLNYREVADPELQPGHALVRVEAAAVNHLDLDIRAGVSRLPIHFPHIGGLEGAGRVMRVAGPEPAVVAPGDQVLILEEIPCGRCDACLAGHPNRCDNTDWTGVARQGVFAEQISVPVAGLVKLPPGRPATDWATVQGAFGTAWHMLFTRGRLQAGERVLINAVGSGIGSAALQLATIAGADVLVTAGSDEKIERARKMGARDGVNYSRENLSETVMTMTDGNGVDLVYDHVGGDVLVESLKVVSPGGRVVTCGAHGGEIVPLDLIELFRAERTIIGSRTCTVDELRKVFALFASGRIDPVIDSILPLSRAAAAHERLANRAQFGKIVLVPDALVS